MSTPILGYWEIRGLAAPIRYLLEQANAKYVDKIYKYGPPPTYDRGDWLKEKFTLGLDLPNLPYFIDGDVKLTQSYAILRYLSRKYGFEPKTEKDLQRVDMVFNEVLDHYKTYIRLAYSPDFLKLRESYTKSLPDKFKNLNDIVGDNKFIAGDYVTYADFFFFEYLEQQNNFLPELLKQYPKLAAYYKNLQALEGIKRYFERPDAIKFPFNGATSYHGGAYSELNCGKS